MRTQRKAPLALAPGEIPRTSHQYDKKHHPSGWCVVVSQYQAKSNFLKREFLYKEYTLTCRLRASSTRSAWRMRTQRLRRWVRFLVRVAKRKTTQSEFGLGGFWWAGVLQGRIREFRWGEYLLALRLANKLADLRAANANPYSNALRLSVFDVGTGQK